MSKKTSIDEIIALQPNDRSDFFFVGRLYGTGWDEFYFIDDTHQFPVAESAAVVNDPSLRGRLRQAGISPAGGGRWAYNLHAEFRCEAILIDDIPSVILENLRDLHVSRMTGRTGVIEYTVPD